MQYRKVIALYIRLSLEDDDVRRNDAISESRSIKNQRELLYDFIKKHPEFKDMEIVEYKDDGYSGTNFDRPRFIDLMSDIRKGKVAVVIVKDFSRLGRDYLESGNFLDKIFPAYGIRFISVNDHYDSNSHIGQTTGVDVGFKNIVNDMYSKDISIKKKSAMKTRHSKGEHITAYPFYGYIKNPEDKYSLLVDEEAAKIVRLIFQCSIDGMSSYDTAEYLNECGIPSPYEYKKSQGIVLNNTIKSKKALWDGAKIRAIIKDERYLGKMISNQYESTHVGSKRVKPLPREEWIIVENTHEAIVALDVFLAANKALGERTKSGGRKGAMGKRTNLFTCPYCNHKLQFSGGEDNHKYMFCVHGNVSGSEKCKSIKLETEVVEQAVLYTVNMIGSVYTNLTSKKLAETTEDLHGAEEDIKKYSFQLSTLKTEKRNVYMLYAEGKITKETFLKRTENDNATIQALEQKIKELQEVADRNNRVKMNTLEVTKELRPVLALQKYDAEALQNILEKIYVDEEGKVELVFKRKDILEEVGIA